MVKIFDENKSACVKYPPIHSPLPTIAGNAPGIKIGA